VEVVAVHIQEEQVETVDLVVVVLHMRLLLDKLVVLLLEIHSQELLEQLHQ
jgi:hypothetical protein